MDTITITTHRTARSGSRGRTAARRRASLRSMAGAVAWTIALTIALVVLGVAPSLLHAAPSGPATTTSTSVRVGPADTLWSIAAAHRLPGRSTAAMVDEIRLANGLTASDLSAGTVLRVPSAQAADSAVAAIDSETAVR